MKPSSKQVFAKIVSGEQEADANAPVAITVQGTADMGDHATVMLSSGYRLSASEKNITGTRISLGAGDAGEYIKNDSNRLLWRISQVTLIGFIVMLWISGYRGDIDWLTLPLTGLWFGFGTVAILVAGLASRFKRQQPTDAQEGNTNSQSGDWTISRTTTRSTTPTAMHTHKTAADLHGGTAT